MLLRLSFASRVWSERVQNELQKRLLIFRNITACGEEVYGVIQKG